MDMIDLARYVGALILVLALVGLAGLAARRFGLPAFAGLGKPQTLRRLAIVESLVVSPRQRLYLVRRDDVEHLVMAGADGMLVVETNIRPPARGARTDGTS